MPNQLPLATGAGLESFKAGQEQLPNIHDRAGLYNAQVLAPAGNVPIAGGLLQEIRDRGLNLSESPSFQQWRIRVEELHAHLSAEDIYLHPIAVGEENNLIQVGSQVQVSFRDNYSSNYGFIVKIIGAGSNGVQGQGNTNNNTPLESFPRTEGRYPAPFKPDDVINKRTPTPQYSDPFVVSVRGRTRGVNLKTIESVEIIGTAAGWYYGAVNKVSINVTSGIRKPKPPKPPDKGNHSSGIAVDFKMYIDGQFLSRGEQWAFCQALRVCLEKGTRQNFGGPDEQLLIRGGLGLYSGNNKGHKNFFRPEQRRGAANVHYDIRGLSSETRIAGGNAWHWFNPPENSKKGSSRAATTPYRESIQKKNNLEVAANALNRVKEIFDDLKSTSGAYRTNKNSWKALMTKHGNNEQKAISDYIHGTDASNKRYGVDKYAKNKINYIVSVDVK